MTSQAQTAGPVVAVAANTGARGQEVAAESGIAADTLTFHAFSDALFAELELPPVSASADTLLAEDLGFDSVLLFELLLVIEDWTGVLLPEALLGQLLTIGDVYEVYRTRRSHR